MKNILIISILITCFYSCNTENLKREKANKEGVVINFDVHPLSELNQKILETALEYLDTLNKDKIDSLQACRLFVEQKNTEVSYKLSSVIHFSSVKDDLPLGYIEFRGRVILIHTGFERLFNKQNVMPEDLREALEGKIINNLLPDFENVDPEFSPGVYSFPTWEIIIQDDSMVVNRNAEPVWRVKTTIHHLPDSIK